MFPLHKMLTTTLFALSALTKVTTFPTIKQDVCHEQPRVYINTTTIYGLSTPVVSDNGNYVSLFGGIRYALKPVRFSLSEPYIFHEQEVNATSFGYTCFQNFIEPGTTTNEQIYDRGSTLTESEDCLSLNIWTPTIAESKYQAYPLLPVMFYIYGGDLQFGSSNTSLYQGANLASHDVVVVTFNYRTNVFGFPSASQIPTTENNLGLFDQRLALKWVRDNIHAFGGDKNKITIFGQSAGSASVDSLLLEGPAESPPFRSAILESGTTYLYLSSSFNNQTDGKFDTLAHAVGCTQGNGTQDQLRCMRNIPATKLKLTEQKLSLSFYFKTDNITTFADPVARRVSGKSAKVPIIIGTNLNEGTVLTIGQTNLTAFVTNKFPGLSIETVKKYYPVPHVYKTDGEAISAIDTDYRFHCPAIITATAVTRYLKPATAYRYLFNVTFPNTQPIPGLDLGVYHSSELPLVFGNTPNVNSTAQEVALTQYMQSVWTNFAKNPMRSPWPNIENSSYPQNLAVLGLEDSAGATLVSSLTYDAICNLWSPYILKQTGAN